MKGNRASKKIRPHATDGLIQILLGKDLRDKLDILSQKEKVSLQTLGKLAIAKMLQFYEKA